MKIIYGFCQPSLPVPIILTHDLDFLLGKLFDQAQADYAASGKDLSSEEIKDILHWSHLKEDAEDTLIFKNYWHFMPIDKHFKPYLVYKTVIY